MLDRGGPGTERRKIKERHANETAHEEKQLQSTFRKLGINPVSNMERVVVRGPRVIYFLFNAASLTSTCFFSAYYPCHTHATPHDSVHAMCGCCVPMHGFYFDFSTHEADKKMFFHPLCTHTNIQNLRVWSLTPIFCTAVPHGRGRSGHFQQSQSPGEYRK
jgi:hypothetical protein